MVSLTNIWYSITIEFIKPVNSTILWIHILLTFHIKKSHLKKGVLQNIFKQTWCTSRNLGTSEEISYTCWFFLWKFQTFHISSKQTINLKKLSSIKFLVTDIKCFLDNIILHRQFWTKWWCLKFPSGFKFKVCLHSLLPFVSFISALLTILGMDCMSWIQWIYIVI